MRRGDVFMMYCDGYGYEQKGYRPVLVLQNDKGNEHSPTTIVCSLSSKIDKKLYLPVHAYIGDWEFGQKPSIVLCEQIRTVDKGRLIRYLGRLSEAQMYRVDSALRASLAL